MLNENERLKHTAEAVLFAAGDSVSADQLAKVMEITPSAARALMEELWDDYEREERGMQILVLENRYQMTTRPLYYETVRLLYRSVQKTALTDTQLETLAIIAYKQPVTRQEVDDIRGVHSDSIVNRLIEYGLVGEIGRMKAPGRPILLGTTEEFLKNFGFSTLRDIPDLPEANLERLDQMELEDDEDQTELEFGEDGVYRAPESSGEIGI